MVCRIKLQDFAFAFGIKVILNFKAGLISSWIHLSILNISEHDIHGWEANYCCYCRFLEIRYWVLSPYWAPFGRKFCTCIPIFFRILSFHGWKCGLWFASKGNSMAAKNSGKCTAALILKPRSYIKIDSFSNWWNFVQGRSLQTISRISPDFFLYQIRCNLDQVMNIMVFYRIAPWLTFIKLYYFHGARLCNIATYGKIRGLLFAVAG